MASAPASVLAINGGSSSIKFAVYHAGTLPTPSLSCTGDRLRRDGTKLSRRLVMAHVIRPDVGDTRLDTLQRWAFAYFLYETSTTNGLVADRTQTGAPASIAAVGFPLGAYPPGIEALM